MKNAHHVTDEYRFGSIEAKIQTSQTDDQIKLQLKANMILSTVEQLKKKVRENIPLSKLSSLTRITTYGIALSATDKQNLVLRMIADFTTSDILFESLFCFDAFSQSKAKFDCILEFVIKRLLLPESRTPSASASPSPSPST